MAYHDQPVEDVLDDLDTSVDGLNTEEAERRQEEYGLNEISNEHEISRWAIFIDQFKSNLVLILVAATIISAFLGDWAETIAILVILLIMAVMGYVQEFKAEKAIEELKKLAAPDATVKRDGTIQSVPSNQLVPGDILYLKTGDKVPADARLFDTEVLETQEAVLTGESVPVKKETGVLDEELQVGDQLNMVFSGTTVTKGKGTAIVTGTGMQTEMGKIADMMQSEDDEMTPLQKKLDKVGGRLTKATLVIAGVIFLAGLYQGLEILHMFELSVALAVAAVPEGLPLVITLALAFGIKRMKQRNTLVRDLPSVETLGSTTVICTDKTGTLTHNEMTVKKVYTNGKVTDVGGTGYEPDGAIEGKVNPTLFEIGALCNDAELEESSWNVIGDPTEGCLLTSARKAGLNENELREQYPRQGIVPFNSKRKRMSTVHDIDGEHVMYTKGAPDLLLEHCNRIWLNGEEHDLTAENKQDILDTNKEFAQDALRVLGFAYKRVEAKDEYTNDDEDDLVFVGLQGMIDPPREEVKEAIQKCKNAGIDVIMVTGDHKDTAVAIGRELGLEGSALMGDEAFQDDASIYARVSPERKKKLVEELQDRHEIVAMTGDGVNDAPALKKADIGIAMGIKGTDVAKEASEMVLTDDNFSSIVDAVEEGRGIFDNIKKFVNYLLSSNFGEVLVLFLAMIIGFTGPNGEVVVPLATLQLLWMNIVTDSLPAFALGVDPPEHDIMDRAPRDPDEGIITQNMALNILLIGFMICAATLYLFNRDLYLGKAHAQTVALTTLVMMEIVRLQMIRQGYHIKIGENPFLIWSVVGVLALQMLAMYTPLSEVLGLVALGWVDWAFIAVVCAGMFAVGIVASHFIKMVTHQRD